MRAQICDFCGAIIAGKFFTLTIHDNTADEISGLPSMPSGEADCCQNCFDGAINLSETKAVQIPTKIGRPKGARNRKQKEVAV